MSNEKIVAQIQQGINVTANQERLWEKNKGFVAQCISKYVGGCDGQDFNDFLRSSLPVQEEDIIEPEELENAAYEYVRLYGDGGEMHERGGVAVLIESVVFTEEKMQVMGIPEGALPAGWWIGFKITDEEVWQKVKDGTYPMFSIEGEAERVEV